MTTRAGEAFYELNARDTGLRRSLRGARDDISATGRQAEGGFLRGITGGLGRFGGALATVGRQAAIIGGVGIAALGGIGVWAVTAGARMETFNTQWEVLLGSTEAAQARMAELKTFAATTPFEIPDIVEASRTLQVFTQGALATGDGLRLVGDIAAGTGRPIQETSMWIGRMYDALQSGQPFGEAAMRLQEMGALSGAGRRKIEDLAEGIKDGSVTMNEAWAETSEVFSGFSGLMEKQSKTLAGQWSNLLDNVGQAAAGIGELLLPLAKSIVEGFNAALPVIREVLIGVFEAAEPILRMVGDALGGIIRGIGELLEGLESGKSDLSDQGVFGIIASAVMTVAGIVEETWPVIRDTILGVVDVVVSAIADNWPAIATIAETVFGIVREVIETVGPIITAALSWIAENVIPPLLEAFEAISAWVLEHWPEISHVIELAAGLIGKAFSVLWPILEGIGRVVLPLLGKAFEYLLPILALMLEAVTAVVAWFEDVFIPAIVGVADTFAIVWETVSGFFADVWNGMLRLVGDVVRNIIGAIRNLMGVAASIPGPWQQGAKDVQKALDAMAASADTWGEETTSGLETTWAEQKRLAGVYSSATARAYADGIGAQGGYLAATTAGYISKMTQFLEAYSPPRFGPLKDIARWAESTGVAYADSFLGSAGAIVEGIADIAARARGAAAGDGLALALGEAVAISRSEVTVRHELSPGSAEQLRAAGFDERGVADYLAAGTEALGLVRNLEHAASIGPGS